MPLPQILYLGSGLAVTHSARRLMSFAFECLCSPQAAILGFLSLGKQRISPVIVCGRSCLPEDFPGFIDITLSLCILRVECGETLQHADVPLGDQCQLRLKLLYRYVLLLQDFEEAQDGFAVCIKEGSQFVDPGLLRGTGCLKRHLHQRGNFFRLETGDVIDNSGATAIGLGDEFANGTLMRLVSHLFLTVRA
jgi:hypothetical protein